ncbi:SDR family NAD(P)-dependent oxidoreductase [Nocardia sp. NPDC051756]|uniref:SDR family NAD(P)-dependent oxidoreductase n=1 Tax=Nocardia sp. NPDC051756 TaxID=3154751 RepID=UPI0034226AC9
MTHDEWARPVVWVTGAGNGIGRAVALAFADHGDMVVVTDINEPAVKTTLALIDQADGRAARYCHDVADLESWRSLTARINAECGVPDTLLNCAEIPSASAPLTSSANHRRGTVEEFDGVLGGSRIVGEIMAEHYGTGRILNVAATSAWLPDQHTTTRDAATSTVLTLTELMRIELSAHGIQVSAVCPDRVHPALPGRGSRFGCAEEVECRGVRKGQQGG